MVWMHNLDYNWKTVFDKKPIATIRGPSTVVHGMPAGKYLVHWIDTETGRTIRTDRAVGTFKGLGLKSPDIATDIAAVIEGTK
jgi:hypothetical protein